MKHSTNAPTKAEAARMARLKEIGCIACRLEGIEERFCGATEVHHLLSGNRRRGHLFTIPLGEWHHRAKITEGLTARQAELMWGPSLARGSKPFHERYGDDDALLEDVNALLRDSALGPE